MTRMSRDSVKRGAADTQQVVESAAKVPTCKGRALTKEISYIEEPLTDGNSDGD